MLTGGDFIREESDVTGPTPSAEMPSRRILLAGMTIGAVAEPGVHRAAAQQPAPAADDGPKVWLDLTQKQLDDAYDQSKYARELPRGDEALCVEQHRDALPQIGEPKRMSYGPSPIERLEIYSPKAPSAPIHIHIHGGAWHQRRRDGIPPFRRKCACMRRALRGAGLHFGRRERRRPDADDRTGAPGRGLDRA